MMKCLDSFERFLHDEKHGLPLLVEAGLAMSQFESIHPFLTERQAGAPADHTSVVRQRRA